jgi:hypothetical protein
MPADAGSNDGEDMTMPFCLTWAKHVGETRRHDRGQKPKSSNIKFSKDVEPLKCSHVSTIKLDVRPALINSGILKIDATFATIKNAQIPHLS